MNLFSNKKEENEHFENQYFHYIIQADNLSTLITKTVGCRQCSVVT